MNWKPKRFDGVKIWFMALSSALFRRQCWCFRLPRVFPKNGTNLKSALALLTTLVLGGTCSLCADVRLAVPFQDHAVLQRDRPLPVWGWANPGERVRVTLGNTAPVETTANAAGRWRVTLPPQRASATPVELVAEGKNRIVVRDLLVGEVWLCSGQSNMEFRLGVAATAKEDIAAAEFPQIRQLKVARNPRTTRQQEVSAAWAVCSPATAGEFSAVGFHFARELWVSLRVPVGLINCSHGNSPVEAWMSAEALASEPEFQAVADRWAGVLAKHPAASARYEAALKGWQANSEAARAAGQKTPRKPSPPVGPNHQQEPAALFNGMISPVLPYAVRGFLWYQGEGNARRAAEYQKLFGALIRQWRRDFDAPEAPFFWVQLPGLDKMPPTTTHADWIALREAQTATLALPATGQAITVDLGDPTDIHPRCKREVGARLARLARHRVYGEAVEDGGPELVRATARAGVVDLEFSHTGGMLKLGGEPTQAFELADDNGPSTAPTSVEILDGNRLRLHAPSINRPTFVRHAWRAYPTGWLLNAHGLPSAPFSRRIP
jgi:sialate O-acetylesterase